MNRRIVYRSIVIWSYICALCVFSASLLTSHTAIHMSWTHKHNRYDASIEYGTLVVRKLHRVSIDHRSVISTLLIGCYGLETEDEFRMFEEGRWYHGDNSRWERDGYSVEQRSRMLGFEIASGKYEYLLWRSGIPIIPFSLIQIPYWACLFLFSIIPLWSIRSKLQSIVAD